MLAGALTALAIFTRHQGILLIVPLGVEAWMDLRERRGRGEPLLAGSHVSLVLPLLAYAGYFLWVRLHLGFGGGPLSVASWWGNSFVFPWTVLTTSVEWIRGLGWRALPEIFNLSAAILLGVSIVFLLRRRFPWSYTAYALASVIPIWFKVSSYVTPMISVSRFVIVVFPMFVVLAMATRRRPWLDRMVLVVFPTLQAFLFLQFVQYRFVA